MNVLIAQDIQTRNELSKMSAISNWFVSYQNNSASLGIFQDSVIGTAKITEADTVFDKWHAMSMLSHIKKIDKPINFGKQVKGREIVSTVLPKITIRGQKPKFYKENYRKFFGYNEEDINIEIDRGELVSGVIDKAVAGQGGQGSIFHLINNEYGAEKAMDTLYAIQQISNNYLYTCGMSIGIRDVLISEDATKQIKNNTYKIILSTHELTEKLNQRQLIPPLGISLEKFYEDEQIRRLAPGDNFVYPILNDIHYPTHALAQMVYTGAKGSESHMISINGAIGVQTINGMLPKKQFGWARTSPYFTRYDTSAMANGYIPQSFREGIESDVYPFIAGEARHGLISNALSTSISGEQNRLSIKNLESIICDNFRKAIKKENIIQPLYAECGLDPRRTESVKFNTITLSDKDFAQYHSKSSNKADQKFLDHEFKQLLKDREDYREIFMKLEAHDPHNFVMSTNIQMPMNPFRIIEKVSNNFKDEIKLLPSLKQKLDVKYCVEQVEKFCDELSYVYYNENQKNNKMKIPKYIEDATFLAKILVRGYCNYHYLTSKNINNELLDVILRELYLAYKKALVDPGTCIGVIAAQSISEPLTQFVLDSKHRSGLGGSKTNTIVRIKEILGARPTDKMKNPSMLLMVHPEFEENKDKVQEITNHIEMMKFKRFVNSSAIFYEPYGAPIHPEYKHESAMIKQFEKHTLGSKVPNDLTNWCIRFELNKEEMLMKSMKMDTIVLSLKTKFTKIHFVHTNHNSDKLIIRCYIRNARLNDKQSNDDYMIKIMHDIHKHVIRGVQGIQFAEVVKIVKHKIADDGSLQKQTVFGIETTGSNLKEILKSPFIDPTRSQSDSIIEIQEIYGIEAARSKIINEIYKTSKISRFHSTIYADEMTVSGNVTSIQRTGLQKREMSNVTLRLSFQSSIQVLEQAAVNGLKDEISGISGPLILGKSPNIGTTYNQIGINYDFIRENTKSIQSQIDEL